MAGEPGAGGPPSPPAPPFALASVVVGAGAGASAPCAEAPRLLERLLDDLELRPDAEEGSECRHSEGEERLGGALRWSASPAADVKEKKGQRRGGGGSNRVCVLRPLGTTMDASGPQAASSGSLLRPPPASSGLLRGAAVPAEQRSATLLDAACRAGAHGAEQLAQRRLLRCAGGEGCKHLHEGVEAPEGVRVRGWG